MTQLSVAPLALLIALTVSAPVLVAQTASSFEKVPSAALVALAEARGKPFMHGLVFVNGHYLAPPYIVSRYGTALAVNGVQISGQLVPWSVFLATQSTAAAVPVPAVANAPAAAGTAPAATSSAASTVDDLFGEEAPAPAPAPATAPTAPAVAADPSVKFVPNAKSDLFLRRINTMRTDLDRALRGDQFFFFGTKYARVNGNSNTALELLAVLPEAMRDAADAADLQSRLRAAGITYIGPEVCADLIVHRVDYPALIERRRKMKEDADNLRLMQQEGSVL